MAADAHVLVLRYDQGRHHLDYSVVAVGADDPYTVQADSVAFLVNTPEGSGGVGGAGQFFHQRRTEMHEKIQYMFDYAREHGLNPDGIAAGQLCVVSPLDASKQGANFRSTVGYGTWDITLAIGANLRLPGMSNIAAGSTVEKIKMSFQYVSDILKAAA